MFHCRAEPFSWSTDFTVAVSSSPTRFWLGRDAVFHARHVRSVDVSPVSVEFPLQIDAPDAAGVADVGLAADIVVGEASLGSPSDAQRPAVEVATTTNPMATIRVECKPDDEVGGASVIDPPGRCSTSRHVVFTSDSVPCLVVYVAFLNMPCRVHDSDSRTLQQICMYFLPHLANDIYVHFYRCRALANASPNHVNTVMLMPIENLKYLVLVDAIPAGVRL